jgi:YbbR domain-containing protein
VEQRVGLNVPPNVSLVSDNQSVLVQVRIEPQTGARTVTRKPLVIGVTSPLTATISPASVDIVLSGPLPRLNTLTDADVRVEVDASSLAPGVQQLTPRVITPDGITVQSIIPATVQVEVKNENASPQP